jgi:hypothetical protein
LIEKEPLLDAENSYSMEYPSFFILNLLSSDEGIDPMAYAEPDRLYADSCS